MFVVNIIGKLQTYLVFYTIYIYIYIAVIRKIESTLNNRVSDVSPRLYNSSRGSVTSIVRVPLEREKESVTRCTIMGQ